MRWPSILCITTLLGFIPRYALRQPCKQGLLIVCGALRILLVCWILLNSVALYGETPAPGISSNKPKAEETPKQKTSYTDQRGTEQTPLIIKVLPPENTAPKPDKISDNQKSEPTVSWWPSANAWLVIFTCGLFAATVALVRATQALVRGADNTAKHQLRAYVGIQRIIIGRNNPLVARVFITNTGKTMAKHVTVTIGSMLHFVGTPQFESGERQPKIVVMPNEVCGFTQEIGINPNADFLRFSREGMGTIYVWGRIDYSDVFGELHWTTFRFEHGEHITTDPLNEVWTTKYAADGNDAD